MWNLYWYFWFQSITIGLILSFPISLFETSFSNSENLALIIHNIFTYLSMLLHTESSARIANPYSARNTFNLVDYSIYVVLFTYSLSTISSQDFSYSHSSFLPYPLQLLHYSSVIYLSSFVSVCIPFCTPRILTHTSRMLCCCCCCFTRRLGEIFPQF